MSVFEQYLFEGPNSNAVSSYCGDSAEINNTPADASSEAAEHFESVSYRRLEGMVVGSFQDNFERSVDEGEESSFGDQTILSSNASSDLLAAERYGHVTASDVPPPLQPSRSCPLSITTCSSVFMELDERGQLSDQESLDAFSFQSSLLDSSFSMTPINMVDSQPGSNESSNAGAENHRQLIEYQVGRVQPSALSVIRNPPVLLTALGLRAKGRDAGGNNTDWFSNFTESDWDNFHARAKMVLRSLPSTNIRPVCRLPPMPPRENEGLSVATDERSTAVPVTLIPSSLICPICQNAIIGALTLDCECGINVCTACWEYTSVTKPVEGSTFDLAYDLEYTFIPSFGGGYRQECPCCLGVVQNSIGCTALDVAILRIVENLDRKYVSFQRSYYQRLTLWRDEVLIRGQVGHASNDEDYYRDEQMVAQLVLEEENMWKQRNKPCTRNLCIPGTLSFVAAMVASIAIKFLAQNHHTSS